MHANPPSNSALVEDRVGNSSSASINTKGAVYPKLVDPSDEKFIACALAAKADFLITGNTKHFPQSFRSVAIVTPRTFCDDLLRDLPAAA
jgi:predicted nucleic acid-binding protein